MFHPEPIILKLEIYHVWHHYNGLAQHYFIRLTLHIINSLVHLGDSRRKILRVWYLHDARLVKYLQKDHLGVGYRVESGGSGLQVPGREKIDVPNHLPGSVRNAKARE
ncbi:hypothetical protein CEXT_678161 [Caerostris extrusa]|uniref:Uncharacterized protein n=1 Tax=Caerostris extrusa TaxID=172846 RepID=A0AAV4Y0V9_CAEEX|nr:hypothetical protein CEXT_678161 [Caerostris extrusa]